MLIIPADILSRFNLYEINAEDIEAAYISYDAIDNMELGIKFYLKQFHYNSHKNNLLLATQLIDNEDSFEFAFWFPEKYSKKSPLEVLYQLTDDYGLLLQIAENKEKLIIISGQKVNSNSLDILSHVKILEHENIDNYLQFFCNVKRLDYLNSYIFFHYTFALNTNKYLFWLRGEAFEKLSIRTGWKGLAQKVIDSLQIDQQTKIIFYKQANTEMLIKSPATEYTSINVPVKYKRSIGYLIHTINNLKEDERITTRITLGSQRCLFCNEEANSDEHIISEWLRPFIKEKTMQTVIYNFKENDELNDEMKYLLSDGKKESSKHYTAKLVCTSCNNTWMSNLENNVKSILVKNNTFIDRISGNVNENEAKILSIWAILKSILIIHKYATSDIPITYDAILNIKDNKIDPGFIVDTIESQIPDCDIAFAVGLGDNNFKLKTLSIEMAREFASQLFICVIQINNLMFRVSYLPKDSILTRVISLKKTHTLYPFKHKQPFLFNKINHSFWKKIQKEGFSAKFLSRSILLKD